MSLQGNLSDLPLIDLVQVLVLQNKTGILSVVRDFSQAQVCFRHSKVYSAFVHHAQAKGQMINRQGEEALYDLLNWPDGQFVFELTAALPNVHNLHNNWDYIILEQCRRQDELARTQASLNDVRPRLALDPPTQAQISLNLDEWQVLLQVDGERNLPQIAANIHKPLDFINELAHRLEAQGLLEAVSRPLSYCAEQTIVKAERCGETIVYQTIPPMRPALRWSPPLALAVAGSGVPARPADHTPTAAPKVGRSLISGIIARIRGL